MRFKANLNDLFLPMPFNIRTGSARWAYLNIVASDPAIVKVPFCCKIKNQ